jgi:ABC-type sugar transport system substrate-binding protein
VHRQLVERVNTNEYRLAIRPLKRRPYRLGYGGQSTEFSFSREVAESIRRAASQEGVDLLALDNRYSPSTAVRNADTFVRERMDLVVEFQTDEQVAPVVSLKLLEAQIPLIAVEIPHPIFDSQGREINQRLWQEDAQTAIGDALAVAANRLKNIQADTTMRESIGGSGPASNKEQPH